MTPLRGSLSEPLTCYIRGLNRASSADGFHVGDTVVIQGSGPIGVLMLVVALEMGAGRVVIVGAPVEPRLTLCDSFGASGTVSIDEYSTPQSRIDKIQEIVGGFGANVVIDCSGHPSDGPEGIEMLRDGAVY